MYIHTMIGDDVAVKILLKDLSLEGLISAYSGHSKPVMLQFFEHASCSKYRGPISASPKCTY